jgi:hypothetical protein
MAEMYNFAMLINKNVHANILSSSAVPSYLSIWYAPCKLKITFDVMKCVKIVN